MSSMASSIFGVLSCLLLLLSPLQAVAVVIPQTLQHTNLLRTIDLTKPYIRDSTALILENVGKVTETEYFWGIPLDLAPNLSYLEVKEKKNGASPLFPIERLPQDDS